MKLNFGMKKNKKTIHLREKVRGEDYMFIPEPDLPNLKISNLLIQKWKMELKELPNTKRERYINKYRLGLRDANILANNLLLAEYFDEVVSAGAEPSEAIRWILNDILGWLALSNNSCFNIKTIKLTPFKLRDLLEKIKNKNVSPAIAKQMLDELLREWEGSISDFFKMKGNNFNVIDDYAEVEEIVCKAIKNNPVAVNKYKKGNRKALGFLIKEIINISNKRIEVNTAKTVLLKYLQNDISC